jgi:hypothetical protein
VRVRWLARVLLSLAWIVFWLFIVGAVGMARQGRPPPPILVFIYFDILAAGFWLIFRLTKKLRKRNSSVSGLENDQGGPRQPGSSLSAEADAFLEARHKERDGDLLAKLHEKTPTVPPHEPAPFPRSNE